MACREAFFRHPAVAPQFFVTDAGPAGHSPFCTWGVAANLSASARCIRSSICESIEHHGRRPSQSPIG